jgi:quercetin dioxygenase-like cupin family protein
MPGYGKPESVVDLLGRSGTGPVWGLSTDALNATLLAWPPGHEVVEHTNTELEVLIVVLEGGGTAVVDGRRHALGPGSLLLVETGTSRAIVAGPDGLRYLSIHRRRSPLQIAAR